jgi:hypothetical protein
MDEKPIEPWRFQPGNSKAVTHGARSERIVLARAKDEYERLITEHPQLQDFADETQAYAVSLSIWSLYAEAIDKLGVMDESDEPRASLSKQLRLWTGKCVEHRQRLGLTPTSQSRLWLDETTRELRRQQMLDALPERVARMKALMKEGKDDA